MSPYTVVIEHTTATHWRNLLRVRELFSLELTQASFEIRGFSSVDPERRNDLERIGQTFIAGYNVALRTETPDQIRRWIAEVSKGLRGFAVEGAAMGVAIGDALFRQPHLPQFIREFEQDFTYLTHVGVGWALSRTPWRRRRIFESLDPIHHWLAFDGLGFHDCYFRCLRILAGWRREKFGYAGRAYDQGVGRALWFVFGGSTARAAAQIRKLADVRQNDLWSGLGLAMAYAGPTNVDDFNVAFEIAGSNHSAFRQGVAFACEAKVREGFVPAHTQLAASAVGYKAQELAAIVRAARDEVSTAESDESKYELWRLAVSNVMMRCLERRV